MYPKQEGGGAEDAAQEEEKAEDKTNNYLNQRQVHTLIHWLYHNERVAKRERMLDPARYALTKVWWYPRV